MMSDNMIKNL